MCRNIRTPTPSAAGDRGGGPGRVAPVRAQGERLDEASQANTEAFDRAVDEIAAATSKLLDSLITSAPPKDREVEAAKRRARAAQRYATA